MKFAKHRPSAARQVISFMVLNLSRFKPKKLWQVYKMSNSSGIGTAWSTFCLSISLRKTMLLYQNISTQPAIKINSSALRWTSFVISSLRFPAGILWT